MQSRTLVVAFVLARMSCWMDWGGGLGVPLNHQTQQRVGQAVMFTFLFLSVDEHCCQLDCFACMEALVLVPTKFTRASILHQYDHRTQPNLA